MNRAAPKLRKRLVPAPAVGVLLNDGRVVPVPLRGTGPKTGLERLLPKLTGRR